MAGLHPWVVRCGALGDMVLLTPLLHTLHYRYGRPCLVVTAGAWSEPLLAGHPDVLGVLSVASRKRPYWLDPSQQRVVSELRRQAPGPVYVCDDYAVDKWRWLLRRAAITDDRCAYANPDCLPHPGEHWIERWSRFAGLTPGRYAGTPEASHGDRIAAPYLIVGPADRADLDDWLVRRGLAGAPLVLLQPGDKRTLKRGRAGTVGDNKQWPVANWVHLIRRLAADRAGYRIVLCGARPEAAFLRHIAASAGSSAVYAAGDDLPLRRLLALCERAAGMISVDTGPAHVAAALGCPLIVLYGSQPASFWRPRSPTGSAVVTLGGPPDRSAVSQIALGEVIGAWHRLPLREVVSRPQPTLSAA